MGRKPKTKNNEEKAPMVILFYTCAPFVYVFMCCFRKLICTGFIFCLLGVIWVCMSFFDRFIIQHKKSCFLYIFLSCCNANCLVEIIGFDHSHIFYIRVRPS